MKRNKRPMGHIAHLRKTVQINYIITLIKKEETNINFMIIYCFFIWILTQGCFVPSLVENGSVVLEKKIFEFRQCIFAISLLSPLGEGWGPSFEQIWIPLIQGYFVPSLVKIGPVVLGKRRFLKVVNFCYFTIISSLKRAGYFIWTNLNPLHPRMLCAKFGWKWLSGSGEEDFKFHQCIFTIS